MSWMEDKENVKAISLGLKSVFLTYLIGEKYFENIVRPKLGLKAHLKAQIDRLQGYNIGLDKHDVGHELKW